jgi:hypothetical protein
MEPLTEEQMRDLIRAKYPDHFRYGWDLFESGQEALMQFKGVVGTPYKTATYLIVGRSFKSYNAILKLCEIAHAEDAGVILRSLFNLLVIDRWISKEDSENRSMRYLGWFWIAMDDQLRCNQALAGPDLTKMVEEQCKIHKKLFEYKDKSGATKMPDKWYKPDVNSICEMAGEVELASHYDGLYRVLSSVEHSDALAYFSMISEMEKRGEESSLNLHSDTSVPDYIRNGFQYFADIFQRWNGTFEVLDDKRLGQFMKEGIAFFDADFKKRAPQKLAHS